MAQVHEIRQTVARVLRAGESDPERTVSQQIPAQRHDSPHGIRQFSATGKLGGGAVMGFVLAHLFEDGLTPCVVLGQASRGGRRDAPPPAARFRDEAEADAVSGHAGGHAQKEAAGIPDGIQSARPSIELLQPLRRTRPGGPVPPRRPCANGASFRRNAPSAIGPGTGPGRKFRRRGLRASGRCCRDGRRGPDRFRGCPRRGTVVPRAVAWSGCAGPDLPLRSGSPVCRVAGTQRDYSVWASRGLSARTLSGS